jgi:uncharacterized membrane protein YgcG
MKKALIVIALAFGVCAACNKTETAQSNNQNAPASAASSDNAGKIAAEWGNANQSNVTAQPAENLLLPQPVGFVNDFAGVVDSDAKQRLEGLLNRLKQRAQIEFALVTVKTTGGEDINNYSLALARGWGVGTSVRGASGGGLLLLVAVEDHRWRIQVSRSLEADMPNDVVGELGGLMNEPFRAGKYGEGLTKCVEALIARLKERRGFTVD